MNFAAGLAPKLELHGTILSIRTDGRRYDVAPLNHSLCNLEKLPPNEFTVACFPYKIKCGSAGWTRAVALLIERGIRKLTPAVSFIDIMLRSLQAALGKSMLTVHHLGKSQSERIVWLCEELEIPYELKHTARDPVTMLAPPDYKALHGIGTAPVITDGDLALAESGAVVEYIVAKYGKGRLTLAASDPNFAQFLYWFHFANGTLQAAMGRLMILNRLKLPDDNPILAGSKARVDRAFDLVDARAREAEYLAGSAFTTADIMIGFSLTTMRYFQPYDLGRCPNIVKYLARIAARPAYQRAMDKGDPGMALLLT